MELDGGEALWKISQILLTGRCPHSGTLGPNAPNLPALASVAVGDNLLRCLSPHSRVMVIVF